MLVDKYHRWSLETVIKALIQNISLTAELHLPTHLQ